MPQSALRLTKTSYLMGLQCPLRLWRHARKIRESAPDEDPYDAAEDFEEEADRVEELARDWIGRDALFQIPLETPEALAIADFLIPEAGGYRLIEVKASASLKHLHLRDLAFQCAVAQEAGFDVRAVEIIHVNKEYRRGDAPPDPAQLLVRQDLTQEVFALLKATSSDIRRLSRMMREANAPRAEPGRFCKPNRNAKDRVQPSACGHLLPGALCNRELPEDWAELLPRLVGKARDRVDALAFPPRCRELDALDVVWSDEQRRFLQAYAVGQPVFDRGGATELLDETLQPITQSPRTFVDFEFEPFVAIPRFPGTKPFDRIPFQWALQRSDRPGETFSFLHAGTDDPRRAFIDSLLANLPDHGSIFVYSMGAEKSVLDLYAKDWFDGEYAVQVRGVIGRLVDLCEVVKHHYAHPRMRGSYSLKRVAPALLGQGYEDLDIGDGMTALREWRRLTSGKLAPEEARAVHGQLLAYCGRDAELMPRIFQELQRLAALQHLNTA